jgi:hypothetical protein
MARKPEPWHKALPPREDLREGRPLDAAEFAVHLDDVRMGRAASVYRVPEEFFARTYMTKSLTELAAQVVRRLSGITLETSAVFNMATQFGGGKTHALTTLYHLAQAGPAADTWPGVPSILEAADVDTVPAAATAVFVGSEFDPLAGRGGGNEPLRRTPWGEIAWQLGGEDAFRHVREHDERDIEPKGDVIRAVLPPDRPALILMDEVLNYVSTYRELGQGDRFYRFLQSLSEVARGSENVCLVVSVPASELEYSASDRADEARLKKLLDRVGKPLMLSADVETAEIVRRRLFDWQGLPHAAGEAADTYIAWLKQHQQLTAVGDLKVERARFLASYPFHPAVLDVFEGKWQSLPRFQRTRGVLRLLALWVSNAYESAYRENRGDLLIDMGSAPLDDPYFRAAVFEQLNTDELEGPITTDIAGSQSSHAVRLDAEADAEIKRRHLHRRVLTTIFFESNGGQTRQEATLAEIRYAVGDPTLDIANVETVLEALAKTCFYLKSRQSGFWFSTTPNLNLVLVSARARVDDSLVRDRAKQEIERMFRAGDPRLERTMFPNAPGDVPDRPALALAVLGLDRAYGEPDTGKVVADLFANAHGPRIYKAGVIVCVPDSANDIHEDIRQLLALKDTADDPDTMGALEPSDQRLLEAQMHQAQTSSAERIWQAYRHVYILGEGGVPTEIDLGRGISRSEPKADVILQRLLQDDYVTEAIGPAKIIRSWPADSEFWSTTALRDAFYSSPRLPSLIDPLAIKRAIARAVTDGELGYARTDPDGKVTDVMIGEPLEDYEVEVASDAGILKPEDAQRLQDPPKLTSIQIEPEVTTLEIGESCVFHGQPLDQYGRPMAKLPLTWSASGGTIDPSGTFESNAAGVFSVEAATDGVSAKANVRVRAVGEPAESAPSIAHGISWQGEVPPQALTNFYMRVLAGLAGYDLQLRVGVSLKPPAGSEHVLAEQIRDSLAALGLDADAVHTSGDDSPAD